MKQILDAYSRLYSGAAFGSIHFDGGGHIEATIAAVNILECAQAACMDRPIPASEINEACEYLASRNQKAADAIKRFRRDLLIQDQAQRFEATQAALRLITRQFGG